jgi:hypothetical protein
VINELKNRFLPELHEFENDVDNTMIKLMTNIQAVYIDNLLAFLEC